MWWGKESRSRARRSQSGSGASREPHPEADRAASPSTTAPSRRRVLAALKRAQKAGTEITVASIAKAANVDRAFIYRRPDLLAAIQDSHPPARTDDDKRTLPGVIHLSPNEHRSISDVQGDTPLGRWIREAALDRLARELGVPAEGLDGAKRAAPRRRNYKERQRQEGQDQ